MTTSLWAPEATASVAWMIPPDTTPGGKPVTALPGLTPRSPLTLDAPVLVTVAPARTAKLAAVPRPTGACAALARLPHIAREPIPRLSRRKPRRKRLPRCFTWSAGTSVPLVRPPGPCRPPPDRPASQALRRRLQLGTGREQE